MNYHGRALIYSAGMASDTSASAALAQSTSFCTVGAPLTPIAPTTSPSTLMGNPPPHAATRASVGMPAKSDGSPWIKLKKSCVETPNRAVYALFCAISMQRIGAPLELVRDHSTIHRDEGASHVRSICRSNKGDHMSDLLRCCQTLDGYCRDQRRFVFICTGEACEHSRIRSARSDYVYPNSGPGDFQRGGLRQPLHRMFAGHINGRPSGADTSIGRRDVDDAPASLWEHYAQFMLHA